MVNKLWPDFWTSLNSDGNLHQSVKENADLYLRFIFTLLHMDRRLKKKKHTEGCWRSHQHVFKHLLAMRSRQSLLVHRETVQIAFPETQIRWLCYRAKCCFTECLKNSGERYGFSFKHSQSSVLLFGNRPGRRRVSRASAWTRKESIDNKIMRIFIYY